MRHITYIDNTVDKNLLSGVGALNIKIQEQVIETSESILSEVMRFRRLPKENRVCNDNQCNSCSSVYLPKITSAVERGIPVSFVLPAFPGKSPNLNKVLGHLPDLAEKLSLAFLGSLCEKVKSIYPPGIKIIICSDGRVFSDVVGMKEEHVSAYQSELDRLIKKMNLKDISTFNLDNVYEELSFDQMRDELMNSFGQSMGKLKNKIKNGAGEKPSNTEIEANRMYRGMTRFLFEDSLFPGQTKSRAAIQRDAKARAYDVIRRSNAWSDLIEEKFSYAVRLSIHPQGCGSKKLGMRLVGNESWMTPWHGVALETSNGFVLVKRRQAEELQAELIMDSSGRPSHYKLENGNLNIKVK